MKEIMDSFVVWWKEKTTSPLYLTFSLLTIAWNWKIFQIIFIESDTLFSTPKVEYINTYIEFHAGYFWIDLIVNPLWHLGPPAFLTFLSVQYLPLLNAWAHNVHLKHYFSRKQAYDLALLAYEKDKTSNLKARTRQKQEQKEQKVELEKALTQEEQWEEELVQLSADQKNLAALMLLYKTAYGTAGRFKTNPTSSYTSARTYIDPDALSRIDTLELAKIDWASSSLELTAKGKYFVRKAQQLQLI